MRPLAPAPTSCEPPVRRSAPAAWQWCATPRPPPPCSAAAGSCGHAGRQVGAAAAAAAAGQLLSRPKEQQQRIACVQRSVTVTAASLMPRGWVWHAQRRQGRATGQRHPPGLFRRAPCRGPARCSLGQLRLEPHVARHDGVVGGVERRLPQPPPRPVSGPRPRPRACRTARLLGRHLLAHTDACNHVVQKSIRHVRCRMSTDATPRTGVTQCMTAVPCMCSYTGGRPSCVNSLVKRPRRSNTSSRARAVPLW